MASQFQISIFSISDECADSSSGCDYDGGDDSSSDSGDDDDDDGKLKTKKKNVFLISINSESPNSRRMRRR